MQKIFTSLAISSLAMIAVSCAGDSEQLNEKVTHYPVKLDGSSSWSFVDNNGAIVLEDEFENRPTAIIDGYFIVNENNGASVYHLDGKKAKVVSDLEDLPQAGTIDDGMLGIVRAGERITFVTLDGKEKFVLKPYRDQEIIETASEYADGLLMVLNQEYKVGFVDRNGQMKVAPRYTNATPFNDGYALATRQSDDETTTVILNKSGEEVYKTKKEYSIYSGFKHGKALVTEKSDGDSRLGFINKKGEFKKLPSKVNNVVWYNSDIIIYVNDSHCGIMDHDGEVLVRPKYDSLRAIDNGSKFLAEKDDKYTIIDKHGEKIEADFDDYKRIELLQGEGFKFMARDGSEYKLIDYKGNEIGKEEFDDYSTRIAYSSTLKSMYLDVDTYINAVVDMVNVNGLGRYKLGAGPSAYLSSPSDYTYRSYFTPDDGGTEGYGFKVKVSEVRFDNNIARYEYYYDSWGYYDHSEQIFNPDAKVSSITLSARADNATPDLIKEPLLRALEDKGYKEKTSSMTGATLIKGDVELSLSFDKGVTIKMQKNMPGEAE